MRDIATFLSRLGLDKYTDSFIANEIDRTRSGTLATMISRTWACRLARVAKSSQRLPRRPARTARWLGEWPVVSALYPRENLRRGQRDK